MATNPSYDCLKPLIGYEHMSYPSLFVVVRFSVCVVPMVRDDDDAHLNSTTTTTSNYDYITSTNVNTNYDETPISLEKRKFYNTNTVLQE